MKRINMLMVLLLTVACMRMLAQSYPQLTNLPTIYIQTANGQDIWDKENYVKATLVYRDGDELTTYKDMQIRGRGNSTWWNGEKKPYRIKFAEKQRFLGENFANAKNWTLLANHADKSMIHNALTYDLGRFVGMDFCPAARFVDLYLNNRYRGTYQISDHVQVKKKRVDVDETTGWFLELANENAKEEPYFHTSKRGYYVNIKNPQDENYSESVRWEIENWVNTLENVVFSSLFDDPQLGYRAYVDEKSLINWYVALEITGDIDGLYSIYGYKEAQNDKLHVGPLWDKDLAWGETHDVYFKYKLLTDGHIRDFEDTMNRLWKDPWFAYQVNKRYRKLLDDGLKDYLLHHVDSLAEVIGPSQKKNYAIWPINQKSMEWEGDFLHNDYEGYIKDLKDFIREHLAYLEREFKSRADASGYVEPAPEPDSDPDGIAPVVADRPNSDDGIYTLSGQRVANSVDFESTRLLLPKGVYLYKGRKVVVK